MHPKKTVVVPTEKNPDDYDEDEYNDEFILSEDLDDSYSVQRVNYAISKNISTLKMRFFSSLYRKPETAASRIKNAGVVVLEYPEPAEEERKATSAEKQMGRIVKGFIKQSASRGESDECPYENYKGVAGLFCDVVERIYYRDKAPDFMDLKSHPCFRSQAMLEFLLASWRRLFDRYNTNTVKC